MVLGCDVSTCANENRVAFLDAHVMKVFLLNGVRSRVCVLDETVLLNRNQFVVTSFHLSRTEHERKHSYECWDNVVDTTYAVFNFDFSLLRLQISIVEIRAVDVCFGIVSKT